MRMPQTLLLLLLGLLQLTAGAVQVPAVEEGPMPLVAATLHALQHRLTRRVNKLTIAEMCHECNAAEQRQHERLLEQLLELPKRLNIKIELWVGETVERPCDHNIFIVNSLDAFRQLRLNKSSDKNDRDLDIMILLTDPSSSTLSMLLIFKRCLRLKVFNAVLLVGDANGGGAVLFYGYSLQSEDCKDEVMMQQLNRYDNGSLQNDGIFKIKQIDLMNCPLPVAWYELPPFMTFEGDSSNATQRQQVDRISGIDGELLKLLAGIFKFRISLLPPCGKSYVSMNYVSGCYDALLNGTAVIAVGALSASNSFRHWFSVTYSYRQSPLVMVVRYGRMYGAISNLVAPFGRFVWICMLISCLLATLMHWLYQYGRHKLFSCLLNVFTTLLGNPLVSQTVPPQTAQPARLIFMSWLLLALMLRSAYQGKLFDVFRVPLYSPIPRDLQEMLAENFTLLSSEYVDFYPADRTEYMQTSFLQRFEVLEKAERVKLFTTALVDNLLHYQRIQRSASPLTSVPESLYMYQLVMYLQRHSVLKFPFDRKIKQLMAAGILSRINRRLEMPQKFRPQPDAAFVASIKLEMLCGLFLVCALLLIIALLIFSLELLSLRMPSLRRLFT